MASRRKPRSPELRRIYHLNYVAKPETRQKLRCREQCAYAIKTGKLTRLPCENCGASKSEAHHEDYSKPLDVKWLCVKCHAVTRRKSHCIHGHALTDENITMISGSRQCLPCLKNFRKNRNPSTSPDGHRT